MKKLVQVTLSEEKYIQNVGQLPDCYLRGCFVEVETYTTEITNSMKHQAVQRYWNKAGGTGGYRRQQKLDPNLFSFDLV